MKYYAVANDPAELMHFGIKGMKWGIRRTDAQLGHFKTNKPKAVRRISKKTVDHSPAYKKASAKLSAMTKRGIEKAKAKWDIYNSPVNKEIRAQNKAIRKAERQDKRNEKLFQKHLELARQGRLKYNGISDDEVYRISDRLALENQSRNLSGRERTRFRTRLANAISDGVVSGIGAGTAGYINARMTGRGRTTADIKNTKRMAAYENSLQGRLAQARHERAENRKVKQEAKRDVDREYYKQAYENGGPVTLLEGIRDSGFKVDVDEFGRVHGAGFRLSNNMTRRGRSRAIRNYKEANKISEAEQEGRKEYMSTYYKNLATQDVKDHMRLDSGFQPRYATVGSSSAVIRDTPSKNSKAPSSNVSQSVIKRSGFKLNNTRAGAVYKVPEITIFNDVNDYSDRTFVSPRAYKQVKRRTRSLKGR